MSRATGSWALTHLGVLLCACDILIIKLVTRERVLMAFLNLFEHPIIQSVKCFSFLDFIVVLPLRLTIGILYMWLKVLTISTHQTEPEGINISCSLNDKKHYNGPMRININWGNGHITVFTIACMHAAGNAKSLWGDSLPVSVNRRMVPNIWKWLYVKYAGESSTCGCWWTWHLPERIITFPSLLYHWRQTKCTKKSTFSSAYEAEEWMFK